MEKKADGLLLLHHRDKGESYRRNESKLPRAKRACTSSLSDREPSPFVFFLRRSPGLANQEGTLHPVKQGVIDEQGFQCAFCMSGFIMATVGFLKTNPNPTRSELAHGISGNLCRCQDYDKILTAMMRGAENVRSNHV
jgi:[2Fe-2S] binding domain